MNLTRLVRGVDGRRTRLHTMRGETLPLRLWPQAARVLAARARHGKFADAPWITPGAIAYLAENLQSDHRLLELGSGHSTLWFAARVARVVTVEPNEGWAKQITHFLNDRKSSPCVEVRAERVVDALEALRSEHFEVAVVDFTDTADFNRLDALVHLNMNHPELMMVVLDDSDRIQYRSAETSMVGWRALRFPGMKAFPLSVLETTVFVR